MFFHFKSFLIFEESNAYLASCPFLSSTCSINVSADGEEGISVRKLLSVEDKAGILKLESMKNLQIKADQRKEKFAETVRRLRKEGKRVAIWTVPAKIATLLNFSGITSNDIECAYDITVGKIGKYIPKADIEIKDEKEIGTDMPDCLIVGAWNYMDFGRKKLKWYLERGGMLMNPLTCEFIRD